MDVCTIFAHVFGIIIICMSTHTNVIGSILVSSNQPCVNGYFLSREEDLTICRTCAVCPPGHVTTSACAMDRNTTCAPCEPDHYSPGGDAAVCTPCTRCKPGTFAQRACNESVDAVCTPCKADYYSSQAGDECRPCRQCPPGKYVRRSCTLNRNTRCGGCGQGKFSTDSKTCETCSACSAGTEETQRCSRTNNTRCQMCPPGHFSPEGAAKCQVCSVCDASQRLIQNCTESTDTVCFPCSQGFYMEQNASNAVDLNSNQNGIYELIKVDDGQATSGPYHMTSQCRKCRQCVGGTVLKQQCSDTEDAVCAPCPSKTFSGLDNVCHSCSSCKRGFRVQFACSKVRDTKCVRCPRGTYSSHNQKSCVTCSFCPAGSETKRRCTNKMDTVCRDCSSGYYSPGRGFPCRQCSLCPPGTSVLRKCTRQHDTLCTACEEGTYTDTWSSRATCPACGTCTLPQATLRPCTLYRNVVCGNCQPGYFVDTRTTHCVQCSYCFPDKPGLTVREPGCGGEPADWQCRPLSHVTNLTVFVAYTTPVREETTQNVTSPEPDKRSLDMELRSETGQPPIVVIILATVGLVLVSIVAAFVVRHALSRRSERYRSSSRAKLALSSIQDSTSYVKNWLTNSEIRSQNIYTSPLVSEISHSCPVISVINDKSGQPDSFKSTAASSGVLQNPGYQKKVEQRVSEEVCLYAKIPFDASVEDHRPESCPGDSIA